MTIDSTLKSLELISNDIWYKKITDSEEFFRIHGTFYENEAIYTT